MYHARELISHGVGASTSEDFTRPKDISLIAEAGQEGLKIFQSAKFQFSIAQYVLLSNCKAIEYLHHSFSYHFPIILS
jgi:hypothetical protein